MSGTEAIETETAVQRAAGARLQIFTTFVWTAGMDNPDQYHVATQDKQLRGSVGRVKAGPTLYISVNGFHLSRPSETQRQLAGQVCHLAVADMLP